MAASLDLVYLSSMLVICQFVNPVQVRTDDGTLNMRDSIRKEPALIVFVSGTSRDTSRVTPRSVVSGRVENIMTGARKKKEMNSWKEPATVKEGQIQKQESRKQT
jgi:hypothetical protein